MTSDDFEQDDGPGAFYPVVWFLVCLVAIAAAVVIVRCGP